MIRRLVRINQIVSLSILLFGTSICIGQQKNVGNLQPAQAKSSESSVFVRLNNLLANGKLDVAENIIRQHLKKYPRDADYLIILSRILHKSGKLTEAITNLRSARGYEKSYEDIYLLEAGILSEMDSAVSCEERKSLVNDYYRYTPASKADVFEQRIGVMSRGLDELQLNISQDELTNNRGTWRSAGVQNKWSSCSGHNIYLGYNTVERYQHSDEEVILGGGLRYSTIGVELEYRQSREVDILAQQSWSGMASITTGFSADLLISGSRKKYDGVDIQVLGLGIDYYIANYQVMAITEKTEYHIGSEKLDDSTGRRYYLAYYFSKKNYIRYGYITGKELDNDGSPNPPYSKIRTVLLTAAMPISVNTTFVIELKRHDQSGYYKQNGISFSVRYSYW